jgi:A/G-specific adenine glycosylase
MASKAIEAGDVRRLRAPLLRWYDRAKRDLPWRRTQDPYAIWVSEVMLQQTTVAAVIPYWERFLERFPDASTLARSREDEVLALWSGLGYYRRAVALRLGALAVMEHHGGVVPEDSEALMGLPGIGRYTAGAIGSVAFGLETPVVDGNVKRVFSRLFAIRQGLSPAAERSHWSIAATLVRGSRPGDLNQAVMELGATVCTPRAPRCDVCPVARWCRALALGKSDAFPERKEAAAVRLVPAAVAWIERRGRVLLERRQSDGLFRGAWDLPSVAMGVGETPGRAIARALFTRHGLRVHAGRVLLAQKHSILASRLVIEVVEASPTALCPKRVALRWVLPSGLHEVAISGATGKIARAVAAQRRSHEARSSMSSTSSGSSGRANA